MQVFLDQSNVPIHLVPEQFGFVGFDALLDREEDLTGTQRLLGLVRC